MTEGYDKKRLRLGELAYVESVQAYVISSQNVFIGDRDGDGIQEMVKECMALSQALELRVRVYSTHSGIRWIVQNRLFDFENEQDLILDLLKAYKSDSWYMNSCIYFRNFRARISPKHDRIEGEVAVIQGETCPHLDLDPVADNFTIFHDVVSGIW